MNPRPTYLLASVAAIVLSAAPAHAAIFLLDPSSTTSAGTNNFPSGADQPYPVSSTDTWNSVATTSLGSGFYSDGSAATGVTVLMDSLAPVSGSTTTFEYNFTSSPAVHPFGQAGMSGVFSTNPTNTSVYGNDVAALDHGGVAAKITGLPSGTYDIYIVAAYTGSSSANRPGGSTSADQNVWAFSSPGGADTIAFGSYGTANELLENSTTAQWTAGDNYARITVTLDAANPDLYIIAEGIAGAPESRGWLSSVQIIPEPSSFLLAAAGAIGLISRRRRRAA